MTVVIARLLTLMLGAIAAGAILAWYRTVLQLTMERRAHTNSAAIHRSTVLSLEQSLNEATRGEAGTLSLENRVLRTEVANLTEELGEARNRIAFLEADSLGDRTTRKDPLYYCPDCANLAIYFHPTPVNISGRNNRWPVVTCTCGVAMMPFTATKLETTYQRLRKAVIASLQRQDSSIFCFSAGTVPQAEGQQTAPRLRSVEME